MGATGRRGLRALLLGGEEAPAAAGHDGALGLGGRPRRGLVDVRRGRWRGPAEDDELLLLDIHDLAGGVGTWRDEGAAAFPWG